MGRVILLGTGSSLNAERAQSSVAVPLAGRETLLIDASSGVVLLHRLEAAGIALEDIRHLFVTHRHFDHAGGLAPLLVALSQLPEAALTVHAAPETLGALRELLAITAPGVEDWVGKRLRWRELAPHHPTRAGGAEVTPFWVDHGIECVGLRVSQGPSTLVYAADTRPSPNVVEFAGGADLLLHEAYGTNDSAEQAHLFGHSMAAEAGRAAREAGAERLVLTHLRAGRFANPAQLKEEARAAFGMPVEAASDLDAFEF